MLKNKPESESEPEPELDNCLGVKLNLPETII